jgi:hypothetical protein
MKKFSLMFLLGVFLFVGCNEKELLNDIDEVRNHGEMSLDDYKADNVESYLVDFATVLSEVVHERKDVREFLKTEALKQFDRNYNVLYYLVSDELIGGESFRDILMSYSSLETIEEIEKNVPLVNILIPEIAFFDVYPEELDIDDDEIPVAVSRELVNTLYFNGAEELDLKKNEIPGFHVFVVNENSHVVIPQNNLKSGGVKAVEFLSPNFDGRRVDSDNSVLKSRTSDYNTIGSKAIQAYQYFYKNDGSINQKAFQRDYIYYGITPTSRSGSYNHSIDEYISYIEVDPKLYTKIADDQRGDQGDPYASNYTREKAPLTNAEQLYNIMWTKGSFDFRFDVIKSNSTTTITKHVTLRPHEIWNIATKVHQSRHSTWFRRSKWTHQLDLSNMTAKKVFLKDINQEVSMGKWNIQEESLKRTIKVFEADRDIETSETYSFEAVNVHKANFSGNVKLNIGVAETGYTAGYNYENTTKETKSVTVKYRDGDDGLGTFELYFYDPVIWNKNGSNYEIKTYNSGGFKFGVIVK